MLAQIIGIGTASPAYTLDQERAFQLAKTYSHEKVRPRVLETLYRQSGIRSRGSVLARENPDEGMPDYPRPQNADDRGPDTGARMVNYEEAAIGLAVAACSRALADAKLAAEKITHLVVASCTGFFAPGLDAKLIKTLKLNAGICRLMVGFMGCHGAFNALQAASAFAREKPGARVLVCAAELCSLHMQYGANMDDLVSNALFADGAGAVVVSAEEGEKPLATLTGFGSQLIPDSEEAMSWKIGNHGFQMTLSARVPALIEQHLKPWMESWLDAQNTRLSDIRTWVAHPGGPRILDAVERALSLPPEALSVSRDVLADHGNMSSPTVLFILDRMRKSAIPKPCVMVGFGPGLVVEAALLG